MTGQAPKGVFKKQNSWTESAPVKKAKRPKTTSRGELATIKEDTEREKGREKKNQLNKENLKTTPILAT